MSTSGADMGEGTHMDIQEAAVIMREADERARHEFRPDHRASFIAWGLIVLLGYGTMWLTVRGQHPFHGPSPATFAVVNLLAVGAAIAGTAEARAGGVGGVSALRRRVYYVSLIAGLAGMYALEGAVYRAGASRGAIAVFEASAPLLVAGLFYLTTSALWLDWPVCGLGLWLLVVAATGGFADPVGVWAVGSLAGGLAFLVTAAIEFRLRRS